jgi:hypothetical protein
LGDVGGDVVGLASAQGGAQSTLARARVVGRAAFFLGGNVTGIDREFSLVVMQTCMGERDRARVLGWACVGEIRGKKREMRLVKK